MPNHSQALDLAFQALADPTRRAIVERLTREPASVSELARPLNMSLPAVMQHLAVLEASGLVRSAKAGRVRTCRINPEALSLAEQWINARRMEWERRLDRLGDYLATLTKEDEAAWMNRSQRPARSPRFASPARFTRRRALVFKAWSSADHVKRWIPPEGFTLPEARVRDARRRPVRDADALAARRRALGARQVRRSLGACPARHRHDDRRHEGPRAVRRPDRGEFRRRARRRAHGSHANLYRARPRRRLDGRGRAKGLVAIVRQADGGTPAHAGPAPPQRSVVHAIFTVERTYDAPVERVWRALSNEAAKAKWFGGAEDESGRRSSVSWIFAKAAANGPRDGGPAGSSRLSTPSIRISSRTSASSTPTRCTSTNGRFPSRSQPCSSWRSGPGRTTLKVTEQGAFLDGFDDAGGREHGTGYLLDKLGGIA